MKAHFDAVKARLNADATLSGKGHDAARLDGDGKPVRATYWVLFGGGPERLDDDRLASVASPDSDADFEYRVRCVSTTVDGVLTMLGKVIDQLQGFVPVIAGRNCGALQKQDGDGDVEPDHAVSPPIFFADVYFDLRSSRA